LLLTQTWFVPEQVHEEAPWDALEPETQATHEPELLKKLTTQTHVFEEVHI